jgi:murein DD-endopeptidase MepM/ murein hydrolase activator NlpD
MMLPHARLKLTTAFLPMALAGALVAPQPGHASGWRTARDLRETTQPAATTPPTLRVTVVTSRGAARLGDVVLLRVTAPVSLTRVEAAVFDHVIPMWNAGEAQTWEALVGIDVETAPGQYPIVVEGHSANGLLAAKGQTIITVISRAFGVRKLRVDPRFTEPPASERPRIEREAQRLNAIFATVEPVRHWVSPFVYPVSDPLNSNFGLRSVFNGQPRGRHNGVDFASPRGTAVHAPAAGRVVLADDLYFTGITVVIDHGYGLHSLMAHLESVIAREGDAVTQGDVVGHVGSTGRSTGPHLHWSVRLLGARVDPISIVALGQGR